MKKIYYSEGPPMLDILNVGKFYKDVPQEIEDKYAKALVKKGTFKYAKEVVTKTDYNYNKEE